jgi:hypothetical protein
MIFDQRINTLTALLGEEAEARLATDIFCKGCGCRERSKDTPVRKLLLPPRWKRTQEGSRMRGRAICRMRGRRNGSMPGESVL